MSENVSSKPLTAKQQKFMAGLLAGDSVQVSAKAADISERQGYRWMKDETFLTAYREALRLIVSQAIAKLQVASLHAVNALIQNLVKDTGVPAAIRGIQIRAAEAILERAVQAAEIQVLQERVEQLERMVTEGQIK